MFIKLTILFLIQKWKLVVYSPSFQVVQRFLFALFQVRLNQIYKTLKSIQNIFGEFFKHIQTEVKLSLNLFRDWLYTHNWLLDLIYGSKIVFY